MLPSLHPWDPRSMADIEYKGNTWLALDSRYSDEEIQLYLWETYGWASPKIERRAHIVLAQPEETEDAIG